MTLEGIEAIEREALAVVLALGDFDLAALAFFNLHVDGSDHGLTGVLVGAGLTMVEHIPLSVNLADRAVGVAVGRGRGNHVAP
jgi:hypothetical protein